MAQNRVRLWGFTTNTRRLAYFNNCGHNQYSSYTIKVGKTYEVLDEPPKTCASSTTKAKLGARKYRVKSREILINLYIVS